MSIEDRSLDKAVRQFKDELNSLVNATITQARVYVVEAEKRERPVMAVSLRRSHGEPGAFLKSRRFGAPLILSLGQVLASDVTKAGKHILRTIRYRYALEVAGDQDALIRWEYDRERPDPADKRCRHHLQAAPTIVVEGTPISLQNLHLATGYVPIEEVVRFCIADLGVKPARENWDETLAKSYDGFRRNLVCPRYDGCELLADERTARQPAERG